MNNIEYQLIQPVNKDYSITEQIYKNRNVDDIFHYLNTQDTDILDPLLLDNMQAGAEMLVKHISNNDLIYLIVDCDVDGFTSAARFINYINKIAPYYAQNYIHYVLHSGKQHGLEDQIDYLLEHPEYKLIVCPDSASSDLECHKKLYELGSEVLVLDHHEADTKSEWRIIINNQTCDYPTKSLSGVGIVYKFCSYLDSLLGEKYAEDLLDLVASGMVADMMSLLDYETRHLIRKGCLRTNNPFLKALVSSNAYSINRAGGMCPFSIAFYVAPYINAVIRTGTADEKMKVFEAMLEFKGELAVPSTKRGHRPGDMEILSAQAARICSNVKSRQQREVDASVSSIRQIIEDNNLADNKIIAVKLENGIKNQNLTGLLANKFLAEYKHPILLLSKKDNTWVGSARGPVAKGFDSFREFSRESGMVFLAQGHASAFGFGIYDENFDDFIKYSNEKLKDCDFSPYYNVDYIWKRNNVKPEDILEIADYSLMWGQDLPEPYIAIENIKITSDNIVLQGSGARQVLKISLPNGISLVKFGSNLEADLAELKPITDSGCVTINVVGTCQANEWNGNVNRQIKIERYEITGKQQYYF